MPEHASVALRQALTGLSRAMLRQVAHAAIELLDEAEAGREDLEPEDVEECDDDEASHQPEWRHLVPPRAARRAA